MKIRRGALVMGFFPNARGYAFAVFEGPLSPVDWGISEMSGSERTQARLRRLSKVLDRNAPDVLVLRGAPPNERLRQLCKAAAALAKSRGIVTFRVSREQVREAFAYVGSPTRYAIAEAIAKDIQTFAPLLPRPRKIWNGEDRRMGLFDAAALALALIHAQGGASTAADISQAAAGDTTNLLGSLLVSHLQLIAMERGALPPQDRVPFFVHVDEFQTFSSDAFASLLSEARKFAVHFALANQYTDQLSNAVRAAVIGNAGTLIVFRVGSRDAELLAPEFRPMDPGALADQEPFTAWLRRGIGRDRIFAEPPLYKPRGTAEAIREQSRQRFGRPREVIQKRRQITTL